MRIDNTPGAEACDAKTIRVSLLPDGISFRHASEAIPGATRFRLWAKGEVTGGVNNPDLSVRLSERPRVLSVCCLITMEE